MMDQGDTLRDGFALRPDDRALYEPFRPSHASRDGKRIRIYKKGEVIQKAGVQLKEFFIVCEGTVETRVPPGSDATLPNALLGIASRTGELRDLIIFGLVEYLKCQPSKYSCHAVSDSFTFLVDEDYLNASFVGRTCLPIVKLMIRKSEIAAKLRSKAIKRFCSGLSPEVSPEISIEELEGLIAAAEQRDPSNTYEQFATDMVGLLLDERVKYVNRLQSRQT